MSDLNRSHWRNAVRHTFSIRTYTLLIVDIGIIIAVMKLIMFLNSLAVGSMQVNGEFTLGKMLCFGCCIILVRMFAGVYHSVLRYADAKLYMRHIVSDFGGGAIFFIIGRWIDSDLYIGFSYTLIITMLVAIGTLVSRLTYQLLYAYSCAKEDENGRIRHIFFKGEENTVNKRNVAIVGAGNVGATLVEELHRNPKAMYNPVMLIDIDKRKIGGNIAGVRIFEETPKIASQIKNLRVHEIIIAIPDASVEEKTRLYELYSQAGCSVKVYDYPVGDRPGQKSVKGGRIELRDFSIEDLLFRNALDVKSARAKSFYEGKRILVTGGGGSIGSELCRQIARLKPAKLIMVDIYENNLYDIQQELIRNYGRYDAITGEGLNMEAIIASVRDIDRIDEIFDEYRPEIVFHAAAHKHVPLMENSGCEALKNNTLGTYNVANASEKYGVEKFLLISTDKAVNPTNIMGASKRMCEMVIQCRKDSDTVFTAVRFGNVLGSNGSVVPLFKKQIAKGGPITLTDKRIIRYFMTIPEAVGLVMETCAMADKGELYVLDMGKPVRILDMAENMIRLSGLKPYEDIDIVEIGLRPGEKLYEELLIESNELGKTDNNLIFIEHMADISRADVEAKIQVLKNAIDADETESGHHDAVLEAIKETVPTYKNPDELNRTASFSKEMKMAKIS